MENRKETDRMQVRKKEWHELCESIVAMADKLEEYKNTGLTPEQIREVDKLYLEKCEEVNRLSDKLKRKKVLRPFECRIGGKTHYRANCPSCESVLCETAKFKYCPYCAQAIDWE